jgi:hypothetical protein
MWFNMVVVFLSLSFIIGSYFVLTWNIADCDSLRFVIYAVCVLHATNMLVGMINLCKCETKVCNMNFIVLFLVYEMAVLLWMNVTYFNSQRRDCMSSAPRLYFWVMAQILMIYVGVIIVFCHFFRQNC